MKEIFTLVSFLLIGFNASFGQWSNHSQLGETVTFISEVFLTNSNDIYAVGQDDFGFPVGDENAVIYKSTNGGQSFTRIFLQSGGDFRKVYFINDQIGFVAGKDQNSNVVLYKTINAGQTWNPISLPTSNLINRIEFFDNSTGYIEVSILGEISILKTNDGGNTWTYIYELSDDQPYNIDFVTPNIGYGFARGYNFEDGIIIKTINGGQSWDKIWEGEITKNIIGFEMISESSGVMVNEDGLSYFTNDGGQSWSEGVNHSPNNTLYKDISMLGSIGYMAGLDEVLYTVNGGKDWYLDHDVPDNYLYEDIYVNSNGKGCVAGLISFSTVSNFGPNVDDNSALISGYNVVCQNELASIRFDFTGSPPWSVTYSNGSTSLEENNITQTPLIKTVLANGNSTYTLTSFTQNGSTSTQYGGAANVIVGYASAINVSGGGTVCEGSQQNITINFQGCPPYSFYLVKGTEEVFYEGINSNPFVLNTSIEEADSVIRARGVTSDVEVVGQANFDFYESPTAILSGNATICYGETATLQLLFTGSGPYSGTISNGVNSTSFNNINQQQINIEVNPSITGDYTIINFSNQCENGVFSGQAEVGVSAEIYQPTNFSSEVNENRTLTLSWNDNSPSEIGYEVYKSIHPDSSYNLYAELPPNTISFVDSAVVSGDEQSYFLRVLGGFDCYLQNAPISETIERLFNVVSSEQFDLSFGALSVCSVFDYDQDGKDDLLLYGKHVLKNQGNMQFTSVHEFSPNLNFSGLVDINNDGRIDISSEEGFYLNFPNSFTYQSYPYYGEQGYLLNYGIWTDIDNDGDLDLFDGDINTNANPKNIMFSQLNNDQFYAYTYYPETNNIDLDGFGSSIMRNYVVSDIDNDGDKDFIGVKNKVLRVFKTTENGVLDYSESQNIDLTNHCYNSLSSGVSVDIDNDLDEDLFFTTSTSFTSNSLCKPLLFENVNGVLQTNTSSGDLSQIGRYSIEEPVFGDLDNDGDLDCVYPGATNNGNFEETPYGLILLNDGSGVFTALYSNEITTYFSGEETVVTDFNEDGKLDIFVAPNLMLENSFPNIENNGWLKIDCRGNSSNYFGLDAKIKTYARINGTPVAQLRVLRNNVNVVAQQSYTAHFGLGNASVIDSVIVEWPTGMVSRLMNVAINQKLEIVEPEINKLPKPPSYLRISDSSSFSNTLEWNFPNAHTDHYKLFRGDSLGNNYFQLINTSSTRFYDAFGLESDTKYCYKVQSVTNTIDSEFSNEICGRTKNSSFQIMVDTTIWNPIKSRSIEIKRIFSEVPNSVIKYMEISEDGGPFVIAGSITNENSFVFTGLLPSTNYCLRAKFTIGGVDQYSNVVCAKTRSNCFVPLYFPYPQLKQNGEYWSCATGLQVTISNWNSNVEYQFLADGVPTEVYGLAPNFVLYGENSGYLQVVTTTNGVCVDTSDLLTFNFGGQPTITGPAIACPSDTIVLTVRGVVLSEATIVTDNIYPHIVDGQNIIIPKTSGRVFYQVNYSSEPRFEECGTELFVRKYVGEINASLRGDETQCGRIPFKLEMIGGASNAVDIGWQHKNSLEEDWFTIQNEESLILEKAYGGYFRGYAGYHACPDTSEAWFIEEFDDFVVSGYVYDQNQNPIKNKLVRIKIYPCSSSSSSENGSVYTDDSGKFSYPIGNLFSCYGHYELTIQSATGTIEISSEEEDFEDYFISNNNCVEELEIEVEVNLPTAIDNNTLDNDLVVYPIPNKGIFSIVLPTQLMNSTDKLTYQITTLTGQELYKEVIKNQMGGNEIFIDVSNKLSSGLYLLNLLENGEIIKSKKIILIK